MKTNFLLFILCIFFIFSGCTRDHDDFPVDESTICSTINQFVNEVLPIGGNKFYHKASFNILASVDSLYLIKQDSLFSPSDIDYIFKQNRTSMDYDLSNCLQNKELVPFQTNQVNPPLGIYSISAPLFSVEKDVVIIRFSYFCGGLCGYGGKYVYKKENRTWRLKLTLSEWIS